MLAAWMTAAFILILTLPPSELYWWTLGNSNVDETSIHTLMSLHKFTKRQRELVQGRRDVMKAIGIGAQLAISECQKQFRHRKWNCSNYSSESIFGKILNKACRETAFIYAITSAGVTHSITRACANGSLSGCHCNSGVSSPQRLSDDRWIYEGCHDNVDFGYRFARHFCNDKETGQDFRAVVNLHNNEAGRMAVLDTMLLHCKCHGVSGACNVQTCQRKLADFKVIGQFLKKEYDTAAKVRPLQITGNRRITRNHLSPSESHFQRPTRNNLVYFEESPDFCTPNISQGSLGTFGRYCNGSLLAKDVSGCEILCCGRDWKTETVSTIENCNCVFKWCCQVHCQQCNVTKEYSYCT